MVMRDMKFPLDMVFVSSGRVVHLVEGAQPEPGPVYTQYKAPGVVSHVLEFPAGTVKAQALRLGQEVKFY
jgi:uncharacterized membrane protein (UPF0127 family)